MMDLDDQAEGDDIPDDNSDLMADVDFGDDAEGDDAEGDDAEGDDAEGDDAEEEKPVEESKNKLPPASKRDFFDRKISESKKYKPNTVGAVI